MKRPVLAAALALAGCNPVAYVPALVPAAPPSAGLRAGLGVNTLAAQGAAELSLAPVGGAALYARGLYGNTPGATDEGGSYVQRGREVGAVAALPLSRRVTLDLGTSAGRDVIEAADFEFDIGCCSGSYRPVTVRAERTGGHAGLLVGRNESGGGVRAGPALRVTRVVADREGAVGQRGVGLFVEPTARAAFASGPVEVQAQIGLSLPAGGDLAERYASVPVFGGVAVALRLGW